jgi:hypothetical protein
MNIKHKNNLVIVAGAAGDIGTAFCKAFSGMQIPALAIINNTPLLFDSKIITKIKCDLSDSRSIAEAFKGIDFSQYDKITFLHLIGNDKYDSRGYPIIQKMATIEPDVYDTNVNTFKYPFRYLLETIGNFRQATGKDIKLKTVLLGGIADKYGLFVIESFCEAKNICRQYMRSAVELNPNWVSGLSINISSMITRYSKKIRPFADITYWLTPDEVVKQSMDTLMMEGSGFKEIEIYKKSPQFKKGYYEDKEAIYHKWSKETGIK